MLRPDGPDTDNPATNNPYAPPGSAFTVTVDGHPVTVTEAETCAVAPAAATGRSASVHR